jgi:hypothetical protein
VYNLALGKIDRIVKEPTADDPESGGGGFAKWFMVSLSVGEKGWRAWWVVGEMIRIEIW